MQAVVADESGPDLANILENSYVSIVVETFFESFFSVTRGLAIVGLCSELSYQGDPLSMALALLALL